MFKQQLLNKIPFSGNTGAKAYKNKLAIFFPNYGIIHYINSLIYRKIHKFGFPDNDIFCHVP